MSWRMAATIALTGCGRLGFEESLDGRAVATRPDCAEHQSALFCDGFEDPGLSAWKLLGTVRRATTPVIRGDAVLQADTQAAREVALARVDFGPIASGLLAIRGWFYVPSGFPLRHFDLIDVKSLSSGGLAVLGYFDKLALYQDIAGTGTAMQQPTLPVDRWLCIELRVEVTNPGTVEVLLDDAVVLTMTGIDLLPDPGYSALMVGLPWTDEGQPATRVFVDEVVIDTQPIGCD